MGRKLKWLTQRCKEKGWRVILIKLVVAETIYEIWRYINDIIYGNDVINIKIKEKFIYTIAYRG